MAPNTMIMLAIKLTTNLVIVKESFLWMELLKTSKIINQAVGLTYVPLAFNLLKAAISDDINMFDDNVNILLNPPSWMYMKLALKKNPRIVKMLILNSTIGNTNFFKKYYEKFNITSYDNSLLSTFYVKNRFVEFEYLHKKGSRFQLTQELLNNFHTRHPSITKMMFDYYPQYVNSLLKTGANNNILEIIKIGLPKIEKSLLKPFFKFCISNTSYSIVKYVYDYDNSVVDEDNKNWLLMAAIRRCSLLSVKLLVETAGVNVNVMHNDPLFLSCRLGYVEIAQYLLDNGAQISYNYYHALRLAIEADSIPTAQMLIERGAFLSLCDDTKKRLVEFGSIEMIKFLVSRGVKFDTYRSITLDLLKKRKNPEITNIVLSNLQKAEDTRNPNMKKMRYDVD